MKERLLCLFALFLPLEQLLFYSFGIDTVLKPYRVFILLAFFLMVFSKNSIIKNKTSSDLKLLFFIFIYGLFIGLFNIGFDNGKIDFLINGSIHFIIGLITFKVFSTIQDRKLLQKIAIYFLIGILISSFFGLYSTFFEFSQLRLRGFFNNPNHLAIAINLISPFIIYNYITGIRKKTMLIMFVFFSVIVFLTASRTGVFLQILNMLFLIFLNKTKILNLFLFSFIAALAYLWIVVPSLKINNSIIDRFSTENVNDAGGRIDILKSALNLGVDSYFSGVGIQQYRFYHSTYAKLSNMQTVLDHELGTHNHFLDLLVNFGLIPFIFFIIILFKIVRNIRKIHEKNLRKSFYMFFLVFLFACSSQEMFMWPLFWTILSLLTVFIKNRYVKI